MTLSKFFLAFDASCLENSVRLCLPFACAVILVGCGGGGATGGGTTDGGGALPDSMTAEQVAAADATEKLPPAGLDAMILADGRSVRDISERFGLGPLDPGRSPEAPETPLDRKARLIGTMLAEGERLINRPNFRLDENGPLEPAQDGLAYVFGGKDIGGRMLPTSGGCRQYGRKLRGLDCSGMIAMMADAAGLSEWGFRGTGSLGDPAKWNAQFPDLWGLQMKEIPIPQGAAGYEAGDIIVWPEHIAMVDVSGVSVLQSNGTAGGPSNNPPRTEDENCKANYGYGRGPNRVPIARILSWPLGPIVRVLRIVPRASFTVSLRWGAQPDVDLHVFEPNGTQVYFSNKQGQSGNLDVDDTDGYGPEHYRINDGVAPETGDYRIGVVYYSGSGPETAIVNVTTDTVTKTYTVPLTRATGGTSPIMVCTVRVTANGIEVIDGASMPRIPDRVDRKAGTSVSLGVRLPFVSTDAVPGLLTWKPAM